MHDHSHMHHERAPIHSGNPGIKSRVKKFIHRTTLAAASLLPLASCTTPLQQYHAPTAHRAIGMSPVTLSFAINQAKNPQMIIEALVNYASYCSIPLGPQWLNYARYQLALARVHGGKLSPEQEKLMIHWLYSQE